MHLGDYLIIAAVALCLIVAVYYIQKPSQRGCSSSCGNNCPLKKDSPECYHILTGGESDANSEGCGKLP